MELKKETKNINCVSLELLRLENMEKKIKKEMDKQDLTENNYNNLYNLKQSIYGYKHNLKKCMNILK